MKENQEQKTDELCVIVASYIGDAVSRFTSKVLELATVANYRTPKGLEEYEKSVHEQAWELINTLTAIHDGEIGSLKPQEAQEKPSESHEAETVATSPEPEQEATEPEPAEEEYAGQDESRKFSRNVTTVSPRSELVVILNGNRVAGDTSKEVFAKAIEQIGAKAVHDMCRRHGIKINGMLPLSRNKENLPYSNSSIQIANGWFVQGNICNRDRVKRLRQIADHMQLDLQVQQA